MPELAFIEPSEVPLNHNSFLISEGILPIDFNDFMTISYHRMS